MVDFYFQKIDVAKMQEDIKSIYDSLNIDDAKQKLEELKAKSLEENFWLDTNNATKISKEITQIEKKITTITKLSNEINNLAELITLTEEMDDELEADNVKKEVNRVKKLVLDYSIEALLNGPYDINNAIISIHAGAGGTEAQDWVEMLFRMYSRYADQRKYKLNILDKLDGDDAGIKSITFIIEGDYAYGYLKAEMGVHRLVRISPFDSNKRRHTSFASVEVMPEVTENINIVINPEDIRVDTYRSGGAGGQHINKTDSAVRITHLKTGIVVQCQNERSQIQNRETAMKMLISKLTELEERERIEKEQQLKGEIKKIEWGSQIRSYVFCPYTLVKDHRTDYEKTDVNAVMDGDIQDFITEYLKKSK